MKQAAITVNNLTVSYQSNPVLWDINLTVPQNILGAILGPNGAGKTTFIKTILGLVQPTAGTVTIFNGQHKKTAIAYVPQSTALDWEMPFNVFDIVLMGTYGSLGWFKKPGNNERAITYEALDKVRLLSMAQTPIGHLSGGQRQRTLLARALAQQAPIYLLDEPFNGVDQVTEETIIEVLKQLRSQQTTILAVHHDLNTACNYFDWAALLNHSLVAHGPIANVIMAHNLNKAYGKPITPKRFIPQQQA